MSLNLLTNTGGDSIETDGLSPTSIITLGKAIFNLLIPHRHNSGAAEASFEAKGSQRGRSRVNACARMGMSFSC